MRVSFHVLGAVGVSVGEDDWLPLQSAMPRGLLAFLALRANQFVSGSQLRAALWRTPPASASSNLRTYVASVRRCLAAADPPLRGRLSLVRGRGYRLSGDPCEFDHLVFRNLARTGRQQLDAGDAPAAVESLTRALAMWRGPAGEDVPPDSLVREQLQALNESRIIAEENLAEARLALGVDCHLVSDLHMHISQHPLRERPYALLIRALYLSGNPASALEVYGRVRRLLAVRLGTDPGPELQRVHRAVLQHDDEALRRPNLGRSLV